jgi:NAD(P)-dependent dehydrogenase (short-subunit alcohol dehydrogenase family)
MNLDQFNKMYNFTDFSVAVTGGAGILGGEIVCALVELGANVAVLDLDRAIDAAGALRTKLENSKGKAIFAATDVLNPEVLQETAQQVINAFGRVDCLINAAGGNNPRATTGPDLSFFDIPPDALRFVFDLNIVGTILPSQIFGKHMADQGRGNILNVSSMNAFRPLTRIAAYSAAKAGVSNFTQWLAVHMAQEYSPDIRVNAIAPGFFLTEQNRFLLTDKETGQLTTRGQTIINHTPIGRFGNPEDLLGTVLWLLSPASAFVTGIVVPIDGGFSAFSGV